MRMPYHFTRQNRCTLSVPMPSGPPRIKVLRKPRFTRGDTEPEPLKEAVSQVRDLAITGSASESGLGRVAALRDQLCAELPKKEAAIADVCATIAMFNGITKLADMTGCR